MGTLCDTDDDNISSIDITDVTAMELSEITRTKGPIDELSSAADDTIGNSTMTSYILNHTVYVYCIYLYHGFLLYLSIYLSYLSICLSIYLSISYCLLVIIYILSLLSFI